MAGTHTINGVTVGVSGHTLAARANAAAANSPGQATHTINGVTVGISGRTLAARANAAAASSAAMNQGAVVDTSTGSAQVPAGPGGSTINVTPTSGGKSGKTLAARAQQQFVTNIVHYSIIFGLVVGAILITKHFVFGIHKSKRMHHGGGK